VVVGTEPETDDSWGIHPAPFIVGLIATAALGGVTIWSGVDTLNNPGPDAVRAACAGKDENCPLYQDGQAKEVRTNALIGATAGTAAITLVLAIVTDWGGSEDPVSEALLGPRKTASQRVPRLWVNVGNAKGLSGASEPDVVVHLSGDF
jgi:hypothetical protein